jgi:hypothetical protein
MTHIAILKYIASVRRNIASLLTVYLKMRAEEYYFPPQLIEAAYFKHLKILSFAPSGNLTVGFSGARKPQVDNLGQPL